MNHLGKQSPELPSPLVLYLRLEVIYTISKQFIIVSAEVLYLRSHNIKFWARSFLTIKIAKLFHKLRVLNALSSGDQQWAEWTLLSIGNETTKNSRYFIMAR